MITAIDLEKHDACEDQVKLFRELLGYNYGIEPTHENIQKALEAGLDVVWANNVGLIVLDGCFEYPDGTIAYWKNGQRHRDGDKPAIVYFDRTIAYWKNGQRHRDGDKPAIVYFNGAKEYYKNGKRHREGDKPAIVYFNGTKEYWKNGKLHRDGDKPAIVYSDGVKEYWKNGEFIKYGKLTVYSEEDKRPEKEKVYIGTTMADQQSAWCKCASIDKGDYSYTISSNSSNYDNPKVINPNGEFILEKDNSLEKMKLKIGDKLAEIEVSKEERIKILNVTVESQRERIKNLKHNIQELYDINDKLNKKIEEDFDKYTKLWKKKNNQKGSKSIWEFTKKIDTFSLILSLFLFVAAIAFAIPYIENILKDIIL